MKKLRLSLLLAASPAFLAALDVQLYTAPARAGQIFPAPVG